MLTLRESMSLRHCTACFKARQPTAGVNSATSAIRYSQDSLYLGLDLGLDVGLDGPGVGVTSLLLYFFLAPSLWSNSHSIS